MTVPTRRPPLLGAAISILAIAISVVSTSIGPLVATGVAAGGAVVLSLGVLSGSRQLLDLGALVGFMGVAIASVDAPVIWPLVGTISLLVGWDVGGATLRLGEQLGRDAETIQLELWYAITSVSVGIAVGGIAYGVFVVSAGGLTLDALVVLLVVALAATLALGSRLGWNDQFVGQ